MAKSRKKTEKKEKETKEAFTKEEEDKVKDRLKALGYID